jgi:hypothetical protein
MNEVAWQDKGGCHEEEGGTAKSMTSLRINPKGIATFVYAFKTCTLKQMWQWLGVIFC